MSNKPTKFDKVIQWFKNQPLIVIILVTSVVIISIGSVTDAISNIRDFFVTSEASDQTLSSEVTQQRDEVADALIVDGKIEDEVRKRITTFAEDTFPDDTGITWVIHEITHRGFLTYVEVEPIPDTVGYEKFVFVISFETAPAEIIAIYALEDGSYELFATIKDIQVELPDILTDELR